MEAGEDRVIRETCWVRVVTEKVTVTVTERGKLIGVTETCTREIRHEVKEIGRERKEQAGRRRWSDLNYYPRNRGNFKLLLLPQY